MEDCEAGPTDAAFSPYCQWTRLELGVVSGRCCFRPVSWLPAVRPWASWSRTAPCCTSSSPELRLSSSHRSRCTYTHKHIYQSHLVELGQEVEPQWRATPLLTYYAFSIPREQSGPSPATPSGWTIIRLRETGSVCSGTLSFKNLIQGKVCSL